MRVSPDWLYKGASPDSVSSFSSFVSNDPLVNGAVILQPKFNDVPNEDLIVMTETINSDRKMFTAPTNQLSCVVTSSIDFHTIRPH